MQMQRSACVSFLLDILDYDPFIPRVSNNLVMTTPTERRSRVGALLDSVAEMLVRFSYGRPRSPCAAFPWIFSLIRLICIHSQ
jgi:hypothetical protein